MIAPAIFASVVIFCMGSMAYVYKYRGKARYESVGEYLRKGWPIFTPLNCLLYLFTKKRARKPIMDTHDFPELKPLQDNWETIREEAMALYKDGSFDPIGDPNNASFYDVGFRTFYKYGWRKFYLNWYGGYIHESAKKRCPKTLELLKNIKGINGAMFSLLPPGSKLTRHLDPAACSLRYHLGLSTPNDEACFINVDQQSYSWRDGDAFLFDETFIHYATNQSDDFRLILMCDVERPLGIFGKLVNFFYKSIMPLTVVPNTDEDRRGLANRIFHGLVPLLQRSKELKKTNIVKYRLLKWTVNTALLLILAGIVFGVLQLIAWIFSL